MYLIKPVFWLLFVITLPSAIAINVTWQPEPPVPEHPITIRVEDCTQAGLFHWGVNASGRDWTKPHAVYVSMNSTRDGVAVRTPFSTPDESNVCTCAIGPFTNELQKIHSIDFVINWSDDSWENNGGSDYHITFKSDRVKIGANPIDGNQIVEIKIKNSQPGGQLRWGVNQKQKRWTRPHEVYWPAHSIPSKDGLAIDSPISAPGTNSISTIQLGPFNHGAQIVTSLHVAVHWEDDWDTQFGKNYNATVKHSAPTWTLSGMTNEQVLRSPLTVSSSDQTPYPITLWIDGEEHTTLTTTAPSFTLAPASVPFGQHKLTARSGKTNQYTLQQLTWYTFPEVETAPLPLHAKSGSTTLEDGIIRFVLYAPGKHFVSVVGDFNQWDPNMHLMTHTTNGYWWTVINNINSTGRYQYVLEGNKKIADPYGRQMTDNGVGQFKTKFYFSESTPNSFTRPPLNELVIYEIHINDFAPGLGFNGVTEKLDYIKDLGVNAIELMPVTEFPGTEGWGYNVAHYFATESSYGTPDDLKNLVKEAHQRGIAVILDMVFNHMDKKSPVFQLYGEDYAASPYFRHFTGDNWGFPDIDQKSEATKRLQADVLRYWIEEFHVDGFRYDATRWAEWSGYNDWGASYYAYAAKQVDPGTYQTMEHLPIEPALVNTTEADTSWHAFYRWKIREMLLNAEFDIAEFSKIIQGKNLGLTHSFQRMPYTESHDEERFVAELREADYSEEEVHRRALTAIAITLTTPGVPMIFAGQEFGEDTKKTLKDNPLHWEKIGTQWGQWLLEKSRELIQLRTTHPALKKDNLHILQHDDTLVVFARQEASTCVVVAINFSKSVKEVTLPLPWRGTWDILMGDEAPTMESGSMTLKPGGCAVLRGQPHFIP